jgi:hypothetical protein
MSKCERLLDKTKMPGGRPKKLTDVSALKLKAEEWCERLYSCCDPHPLMLVLSKPTSKPASYPSEAGFSEMPWEKLGRPDPPKYRAAFFIAPGQEKTASRDFDLLLREGWEFQPPLALLEVLRRAAPAVWQGLKAAHSVSDVQKLDRFFWQENFFSSHAREILDSKELPTYPQAKFSDRKRVKFFAKVFAGLELGIAPTYAIKLLSRFPLPEESWCRRWYRGSLQAPPREFTELVQTLQRKSKKSEAPHDRRKAR